MAPEPGQGMLDASVADESTSKQSLSASLARVHLLQLTATHSISASQTALESPEEANAERCHSDDAVAVSTSLSSPVAAGEVLRHLDIGSGLQAISYESDFPDPSGLAELQREVSAAYALQVEQRRQQGKTSDALEQPAIRANDGHSEPDTVPNHKRLARAGIAAGSAHTLVYFVLPSGKTVVYSWGSADQGQLGHGNLETQRTPKLVQALKGVCVAQLAAGYSCTGAVSTVGSLYVWGERRSAPQLMYHATRISTSPHSVAFSADLNGLHALTADGSVFAVDGGSMRNSSGPDLSKVTQGTLPKLSRVRELQEQRVTSCGCGAKHVAIATSQGAVWTWGQGEYGALGHGQSSDRSTPEVVADLQRAAVAVVRVGCGEFMSFALSDKGDLLTWGCGPLGHVPCEVVLSRPKVVTSIDHEVIVAAACGEAHMLALSDEGQVFAWGLATHGRLGLGEIASDPGRERANTVGNVSLRALVESVAERTPTGTADSVMPPQKIDCLDGKGIVAIACGAMHSAAVGDEGCVYTWGCGKNYALGHGDTSDRWTPQALLLLKERLRQLKCPSSQGRAVSACAAGATSLEVRHRRRLGTANIGAFRPVASGLGHNVALSGKGDIYTWGSGASGQLGHQDAFDGSLPRVVAFFSAIRIFKVRCIGLILLAHLD